MDKKIIKRDNWIANFNLVGEAKVNDYTFKIDEQSEKSQWIYNALNLGVDCGEKSGVVYCEAMGGYSGKGGSKIYAHGKKDDGSDDFDNRIEVDWDDRFDEDILESIGDMCFISIGLEKTDKGKTFYKRFLSWYDAISYVKEHLEDGTVVNVRGNLNYSVYNDKTQVRKNITSIALSKVDKKEDYRAKFQQSVLLDKDSAKISPDRIDKNKGVMYVDTIVLDYIKEYKGVEVRGQFPYKKQFEFPMDFSNQALCKKVMDKLFKVRKGYTQITFEGDLIEGGAVVTATWDDVPDDIKELVEIGIYDKDEALAKCSSSGSREQHMMLKRPIVRLVGDDKTPTLQKFEEKYTEDDLYLDYVYENIEEDNTDANEDDNTETNSDSDDLDWLNQL